MSFVLLKLLSLLRVYIVDYAFVTVLIKESYYYYWKKSTEKTKNSLAGQYQSMDWNYIRGSLESNGEPRALENCRP